MEEKVNLNMVAVIIMLALIGVLAGIGYLRIRDLRNEVRRLRADLKEGDAAIHERVNMINADLGSLYIEVEGAYSDIGMLAEANKLQSASIGALGKRLSSAEYVVSNLITKKEQSEKKQEKKEKVAPAQLEMPEEMTEIIVEEEDSAPGEMTYLGFYELTAYEWTGNTCANGNYPTTGYTVASNTIPLGTRIYIEGYGYYTVEDTGGMAGNVIDIYLGDADACIQFGRQGANVYIAE